MRIESSVITKNFIAAFRQGLVCLHPTDTLPGLTFDPHSENGLKNLQAFKQHREGKGFVHLAPCVDIALQFWQPLPEPWPETLQRIWPAALTVVWRAADSDRYGTEDETLAIRVPLLQDCWFKDCLRALELIPSTSVNPSGEPPLSLVAAISLLRNKSQFYIPYPFFNAERESETAQPSTIISISIDGSYSLLRHGAFALQSLGREIKSK